MIEVVSSAVSTAPILTVGKKDVTVMKVMLVAISALNIMHVPMLRLT